MRTGIYGGSFNPVHNGHIHLALTAVSELGLDRLFLLPSRISPHRSSDEYVSGEDRLEMLRLACGVSEKLSVSDYELRSDRVSYTVYTVREFRRRYPDDELFLLVGSDMFMSFETWRCFDEILRECTLAVVSRNEGDLPELEIKADELRKFGNIIVCKAEPIEISSTDIRKKIAKNQKYSCYLDENVVQYIRLKNLYRQ